MDYQNGKTQLVCIDGENQKDAWFINKNTMELIKGNGCVWEGDLFVGNTVRWDYGNYYGHVKNSISKIKK